MKKNLLFLCESESQRSLTSVVSAKAVPVLIWLLCTIGIAQAQQPALRFIPMPPCRVADTRNPIGPFGAPPIAAQTSRSFPVPQSSCNIPSTARAYSLNVTAVPKTHFLGYITVWPSDQPQPWVSLLNSTDGRVKAGAAIVPAASNGAISVFATDATDIVVDINGYFVDAIANPSALAFFTLPPCRVVDTRYASGSFGPPSMTAWQMRSFPMLASQCNIPTTAQAYSLNYTAVPKLWPIGFLSTWPTTSPDAMPVPWVSTLNVPTGAVTANAAIVPAGQNGAISVLATSDTDVLIDINGYFAPSTSPNDLSLYTVPPCRVRDTRENTGLFSTTPLAIDTTAAACGIISTAAAIVVNATVVPATTLGFLTLWADGQTQPNVSTLNASEWPGFVTSNMAILPTRSAVIDAYGSSPTHLVLDTTGYFAPGTAPAPTTHVLTVTRSGSGTGTVTSTDGKISCGTFCAATYVSTTFVTLTASATQGSSFAGWSGGGCSGTGSCTVGLSASVSVTAVFNPPPPKAQGVYSGGSSNGFSFETIVLPNDKIYGIYGIVSGNVFYLAGMVAGQGTSSNGSFAATVTDYYYTGASYGGSVTGSYVAGVSINGTLLEYGVGTTSFWGTAMPTSVFNFDTPATVSRISGSWTGTLLDGTTATARIYSNGAFTGNDSGCSFSGAVSPDSSNKNFFNVTLTFGGSPCLLPYQTFSGIAVDSLLADGVTRQLLVGVTSGSYGTVFFSSSHGP